MWISTTQYRAHEESQGEKEWRAVSKLSLPPNLTNKTHKYLLLIFHVIWLQKTRDLNPNRKISLKKATHWRNWKIHLLGRTELCTKFLNLIFVFLHISLSQPKRNSSLCWSSKSCWKIKALLAQEAPFRKIQDWVLALPLPALLQQTKLHPAGSLPRMSITMIIRNKYAWPIWINGPVSCLEAREDHYDYNRTT